MDADYDGDRISRPTGAHAHTRNRLRRTLVWLLVALAVLIAAGALAVFLLFDRIDLASFASHRLETALGRKVTFSELHITPGRWIMIRLAGAEVANLPGFSSRPDMVKLGPSTVEIEAVSLLRGPLVVRSLHADGLSLWLEREPGSKDNWDLPGEKSLVSPSYRPRLPTLLDVRVENAEIVYRTGKGAEYRTRLDRASLTSGGVDQPLLLTGSGAYNGTPVRLDATMGSIATLRNIATPFPATIEMASGATTLTFAGTVSKPLDVDGVSGRTALKAPTLDAILAIAGVSASADASLAINGHFERNGDQWRLADATGTLKATPVTIKTMQLDEGRRGMPDRVTADLAFDRLDVKALAPRPSGTTAAAGITLRADPAPDPRIDAHLSARQLLYGSVRVSDVEIAAATSPGKIEAGRFRLAYLGARFDGAASLNGTGRISSDVSVAGADIQTWRSVFGFGAVPVTGSLQVKTRIGANGTALNDAMRSATVAAAITMRGGAISRSVVEMASIDVRTLFRKSRGTSPVTCLLAVLDLRSGIGTVKPLRIRSASGSLFGTARFDVKRRTLDLLIGSEPSSTHFAALDIPVRVSGSFSNPIVRPASWSQSGRSMLVSADSLAQVPADLRSFVQASGCLKSQAAGRKH